jgi:putative peptidoglycan lipid II flippase
MGPEVRAAEELDTRSSFVRNTAVMSVGTALSRVTGFLRLTAMAFAIGVTEDRLNDAYTYANTTPNIIYELALGGILSSVFVPVFVEWLQQRGRDQAAEVAHRVLTLTVVVLSAIMLIGIAAAPLVIRLYTVGVAPGPEKEQLQALASFFLRFFMPQIVFYGIGAVATGLLNAHRRFAAPMFAPILNNLIVVGTFLAFSAMPGPAHPADLATGAQKLVLAVGTTLGVVTMTAALWPSLRRTGYRFRWRAGWRHQGVLRIGHLAKWTIVYVVVNQLGYLVVMLLAAPDTGDYAAYTAAFIFFQLPHAIFTVSIFTALLPAMSSRWADGDVAGFRRYLSQGIRATAFIVVPAAFGYLVLARPIVRLALEHGVATAASTETVASILVFFSIGLFSFSAFQLLLRAFYSMQDTRTPASINIAAVGLNTVLNLALYPLMGVRGLALGHAAAYTFGAVAMLAVIRRRVGGLDGRRTLAGVARVAAGAAVTAAAAWAVARWIGGAVDLDTLAGQAVQVGAAVLAGMLVFLAAALIFRMDEADLLRGFLRSRFAP